MLLTIISPEVVGVVNILFNNPCSLSSVKVWATIMIIKIPANTNKPGAIKSNWFRLEASIKEGSLNCIGSGADTASSPYNVIKIDFWTSGGIAETGCLPSFQDLNNPKYGKLLKKYLTANCSGETRAKIARLIEWLTIGAGVPGCMHGGGSPDGARMMVNVKSDIDHYMELAKCLIDITEDIKIDPKKR